MVPLALTGLASLAVAGRGLNEGLGRMLLEERMEFFNDLGSELGGKLAGVDEGQVLFEEMHDSFCLRERKASLTRHACHCTCDLTFTQPRGLKCVLQEPKNNLGGLASNGFRRKGVQHANHVGSAGRLQEFYGGRGWFSFGFNVAQCFRTHVTGVYGANFKCKGEGGGEVGIHAA